MVKKRSSTFLRQELVVPGEPFLLVGEVQVDVERRPVGPVLIEVEVVRVFVADMEMILDAAGLGARARHEALEKLDQLGALFGSSMKRGGEGAAGLDAHVLFVGSSGGVTVGTRGSRASRTADEGTRRVPLFRPG